MGFFDIERIKKKDFEILDVLFDIFIPKHKEIWLYGCGISGKSYFYFLQECGVHVNGFIQTTSPPEDMRIRIYEEFGVPVVSVEDFRKHWKPSKKVGVLLTLHEKYYEEIMPILRFLGKDLFEVGRSKYICQNHMREIETCSFQIVDHCNLACYACNVAAPIAKKKFMDFKNFSRDIELLHHAVGDRIKRLGITGGEALLHPECRSFLRKAREVFQNSQIELLTNGILLGSQSVDFWENLRDYNITINMTRYPVNYPDFDKVIYYTGNYHINLQIGAADGKKQSCYMPLKEKPTQKFYDYAMCPLYNFPRVIDGRLYPCCLMTEVEHINSHFGTNIIVDNEDSLDLSTVHSYQEVQAFLHKPLHLCRYCDLRNREVKDGWIPSKREKSEWVSG